MPPTSGIEEALAHLRAQLGSWPLLNVIHLAWILLLAFLLIRALRAVADRVVARAMAEGRQASLRDKQLHTLAGLLKSTGTTLIVAFAVLTALPELGISVAPLTVAAGLASVAVGFGAQNLVRDWINGVMIALEDQFVVGETVQIGDTTGRVEELSLRRTVLRDPKGALVHIPNGEIRRVANLSRDYSQVFLDVLFPAGDSGERAIALLDRVAADFRADAGWAPALVDGPRVMGIEALSPSGTTVRLQVRTVPLRYPEVARELRRRILARFAQEGIDFSTVQRVVMVNPASAGAAPASGNGGASEAAGVGAGSS